MYMIPKMARERIGRNLMDFAENILCNYGQEEFRLKPTFNAVSFL